MQLYLDDPMWTVLPNGPLLALLTKHKALEEHQRELRQARLDYAQAEAKVESLEDALLEARRVANELREAHAAALARVDIPMGG